MSSDSAPESLLFRAWAAFVLRFRWPLLGLTIAMTAFAVFNIRTQLKVDVSTEYIVSTDSEVANALEEYRDDFGRDDLYMIVIEGDVFSAPFLAELRALHEELEALDVDVASRGQRRSGTRTKQKAKAKKAKGKKAKAKKSAKADPFGGFGDDFGGGFDDFGGFEDDEGWGDETGGTIIEEVTSLINARQTVFEGGAIRVRGLMDTPPRPADLPALKKRVLADEVLIGTVVGREGNHALIAVRSDFVSQTDSSLIARRIEDMARAHEGPGFVVKMSGMPVINATVTSKILHDMPRLVGIAFLLMALVLGYLFRHPLAIVGSLAVVMLSALWTIGSMAITGYPVTLVTNIIPPFLMCVGMGDSVHIQAVFHDLRRKGVATDEAITRAIGSTGVPVVFTTLTTMAGLLSFNLASTNAIGEMGTFAAWGVGLALVHSVVILPVILSFIGPVAEPADTPEQRERDITDAFLQRTTAMSEHRPWLTVFGAMACLAIAFVGMSRLGVHHDPLVWLGDDHPTTLGVRTMDANVGGTASVHVLVESKTERGLKDRELLLRLERLEAWIHDFEHPVTGEKTVTDTISLLDIVRETNRALHEGDEAHYAVPPTQRGVSDALLLFENAGPDELRRIATGDLRKSHLTVRMRWMDASSYAPFQAHLEQGIAEIMQDHAEVRVTGTAYELLSVVGMLIGDLLRSFSGAAVMVLLMMILLLRDLRLGVISMAPNLLPIALIMGFMGFANIQIDMTNLLIASIVIGIAVDDTIHYLHQFRQAQQVPGNTTEQAIHHALDHAGRALVSTSIILGLGFLVFMASSMINLQRFGMLIALTCVGALYIDIALTPALLRIVFPDKR